MSLPPQSLPPIPEETARVAHAVFPKGNVYMRMRDELGTIYQDQDFADLLPHRGQSAEAPWRLALVTVIQFAEGLDFPTSGGCRAPSDRCEVRLKPGLD